MRKISQKSVGRRSHGLHITFLLMIIILCLLPALAVDAADSQVTTLNVSNVTSPYNSTVILSATMDPAVPGKTISFTVSGVAVGFATTDASGLATLTITLNSSYHVGTYPIVATFAGDADCTASSGSATLTVTQATTSLTVSNATSTYCGSATFSATMSPGTPGKTIGFSINGMVAGFAITDASGVAVLNTIHLSGQSAGNYTINAAFAGDTDCSATSGSATLTVTQAMTELIVSNETGTYCGGSILSATMSPGVAGKTITFSANGEGIGSATTDASGLATLNITLNSSYHVGTYPIVATFAGDADCSSGSGVGTLTVTQAVAALTVGNETGPHGSSATLSATMSPGVSGKPISFSVNGMAVGTATTDASGVAALSTTQIRSLSVGTYPITATFAGDADCSASSGFASFTVTQATTALTVNNATGTYYGGATLSATLSPGTPGKTISFSVNGMAVGTATTDASGVAALNTIQLSGLSVGNYTITAAFAGDADCSASSGSATLTVTQATTTLTVINATGTYCGGAILSATKSPGVPGKTITFSANGEAIGSAMTDASGLAALTITLNSSYHVGTYPIVATFAGDADCSASSGSSTLIVTQATTALTVSNATSTYSGDATFSATMSPGTPGKTISFTANGMVVGFATTDASGLATLTIPLNSSYQVGTYPIVATFAGNLDCAPGSGAGTLTVTQATTELTVSHAIGTYYGGATLSARMSPDTPGKTISFTVSGVAVGFATTDASGLATLTITLNSSYHVGTYPIVATFAGDADCTASSGSATLTVTQATTSLTVSNATSTYCGSATFSATMSPGTPGKTIGFSINGMVAGFAITDASGLATLTITLNSSYHVGNYPIVAAFAGDADCSAWSREAVLTITPAPLTVTAGSMSKIYGSSNPMFTASYSGLVLGENPSVLGGALAFTTPATTTSGVGVYPITPSGLTSANYAITFVDGSLTINKAPLTVQTDDSTKTYGSFNPSFTASYSGFVLGQNTSVLDGTLTFTTPATASSGVNTYPVTPAGLTSTNYTFTYMPGTLTVIPAPMTVRADNKGKAYGLKNPIFTASYSGFVLGQNPSVLGGSLIFTTLATTTSAIGTYPVTPSGLTSSNYSITFVNGTLTITNAPARKPGIPATATASVTVNTEYPLNLNDIFEDADGNPLIYSVAVNGGTPMAANSNYSYTPVAVGTTILMFTANDGIVDSNDTYTVALTATAPNTGPEGNNLPSLVNTPIYHADVSGVGAEGIDLLVNVNDKAGSAEIDLQNLAEDFFDKDGMFITVPSIPGVNVYSIGIPVTSLSSDQGGGTLTFVTDVGSITLSSDILSGVSGIDGTKAEIKIGQCEITGLSEELKAIIGNRPSVQLTLTLDGTLAEWNNPKAPVSISIPYTPTKEELDHPEAIVILYIDGRGNAVTVPNGRYDPATGTVTFTTTHFSFYTVAFQQTSFKDVPVDAWYHDAVTFIAVREITTGTGNGNFSPEAKLTRAQFIVMLMKAYGITPDENTSVNFADAGNNWYTGYLATAKRLGISSGVGNNLFAPEKEITRQEMFTMLYNGLKATDRLPEGNSGGSLSAFNDADDIAPWAKEAMTQLVEAGIIRGSDGKLAPDETTTRAQMAQVLYSLLLK